MRVRNRYNSWVPKLLRVGAITLYPFVLYAYPRAIVTDSLRRHELVHVRQVRALGWLRFYASYLLEGLTHRYHAISYEREAYETSSTITVTAEERAEMEMSS